MIGYSKALRLTLETIAAIEKRTIETDLLQAVGSILATDIRANTDSPSVFAALKDGYALRSADIAGAGPETGVPLRVVGSHTAGNSGTTFVGPREAVKITTGGPLPEGADAVLAMEFTRRQDRTTIRCFRDAPAGKNVLARGADVRAGQVIARRGERLHPALIGLIAAAGLARVKVVAPPRVGIIATGDELAAPGRPLPPGGLYASNVTESMAWLRFFDFTDIRLKIVGDCKSAIRSAVDELMPSVDAVVTSGGAWRSDRDLVSEVMAEAGWHRVFHRIRLGPGKAAGLGVLNRRPVFILPGGPPSHETAFLTLALPALCLLAGGDPRPFRIVRARLLSPVSGDPGWTQVIHGRLTHHAAERTVAVVKSSSRLGSMARKNALFFLPEGTAAATAGEHVHVWDLTAKVFHSGQPDSPERFAEPF